MSKKPKKLPAGQVHPFAMAVPPGEFRRYLNQEELPQGIPWGGDDCRCVEVLATTFSQTVSGLGQITPNGTVFEWRSYRKGYSGNDLIAKMDKVLYFTTGDNAGYRIHSKKFPTHHNGIIAGTTHSDVLAMHNVPSASCGTLEEYGSAISTVDFIGSFWRKEL